MRYLSWIQTLILFWLLQARCAKEVIIDLPEAQPKVVVVCHFTNGQNFRAKISLSQLVNDPGKPPLPQEVDATLSINGEFWDRLRPDATVLGKRTYWVSHAPKIAQTGIQYAISVRVPGYPPALSSGEVPEHMPLKPIFLSNSDIEVRPLSNGLSEMRVPLALNLQSLPPDDHYFAFNITHEIDVYETLNPPIWDFSKEGQTNFLTDGRTFSLLHNIPEPVVLVNENYWADNRQTLYLIARIPFDPDHEVPRKIFIEWRTLSESFYRYHLSLSRQSTSLPFNDPDAVFNNIQGGYGNFSGYALSVDTISIPGL